MERLKHYKKALIVLGVVLLLFVFMLFGSGASPSLIQDPNVTPEDLVEDPGVEDGPSETANKGTLKLVEIDPPEDNPTKYFHNPFQKINFTFSKPVDPESVKIVIQPLVELGFIIPEDSPETVRVFPKRPWIDSTRYAIVIDVKGTGGEYLGEKVRYFWTSHPPTQAELDAMEAY